MQMGMPMDAAARQAVAETPMSLRSSVDASTSAGEQFDSKVMAYLEKHGGDLRTAVHEVGKLHPDLAQAR